MMMSARTLIPSTAVVAVVLVALVAATCLTGPGHAAVATPAGVGPNASFALLRAPAQSSDSIGPMERQGLQSLADRKGVNLDAARAVKNPVGPGVVRLIPGDQRLCVTIPDPTEGSGASCLSSEDAARGRLWTALVGLPGQAPGDARIAIAVPDGARAVTVVATDGVRRQLAVADNVVVADVQAIASYEVQVDGATTRVPVTGTPAALADR
jgi:hypothetical protein